MKKRGGSIGGSGNVVPIPHLEERLLSKAMLLVEEKKYKEACQLFGKLLELNARDVRALYGWAVCSIELGDYSEAEKAVVQLLEADTPYFYEVFRLYLTILIERKDYTSAIREILRIRKKKGLPIEFKEFLVHMQKFCQIRLHEPSWSDVGLDEADRTDQATEPDADTEHQEQSIDWPALEKADTVSQMLLLNNLADQLRTTHLPEIQRFLLDDQQPMELKTMLLCAVKEGHLAQRVAVQKFGEIYDAQLDHTDFLNKKFADRIEAVIRRTMESENPTLTTSAVEMERMFTMNVYPKPIVPEQPEVWAAIFCLRAMGSESEQEKKEVLGYFDVNEDDFRVARSMLHRVEAYDIWS
ncbi:tetratricopeptide repeat protein [Sporolactobacillus inulinus]|jgi:tetratricopeptide (TPR) repeat protein|uniref:Uncharacterized protein n=1 Tax=Sporolactobacillus inulinus CASD TaxID=1069536 RepID=A0A0U1QRG1_9BACL|nr:tetratricopeptide repeat protein [Sporolactobacillus inulinus]KLI03359.1 hypothetical protein SINU_03060 [Sporolactobacillus inulinus CASD]GEB76385.1 hypothetical protein SIN01_07300 [Sporolactobacillus inulinus]